MRHGLGGIAVASYGLGSTLRYNELVVFVLVWRRLMPAAWISHIYVDDETSYRGGHEIWELPKVLADFEWHSRGVIMRLDGVEQVRFDYTPPQRGLPMPVWSPTLSRRGLFHALGWMRAIPRPVTVTIASSAPFHMRPSILTMAGPFIDLKVYGVQG